MNKFKKIFLVLIMISIVIIIAAQLTNISSNIKNFFLPKETRQAENIDSTLTPEKTSRKTNKVKASSRRSKEKRSSRPISRQIFRSKPAKLSDKAVATMLKKHNFYTKSHSWNKKYHNPSGKGFANQYKKRKDGRVIYDKASGLMWQQAGSSKELAYKKAKKYIKKLNRQKFASYNDWRLPTLEEAMTLLEYQQKNGDLYIDPLFSKEQDVIWTTDRHTSSSLWVVGFDPGSCYNYVKPYYPPYVRAVRSRR